VPKEFSQKKIYVFGEVPNKKLNERLLSRLTGKRGASLRQLKYQVFLIQSVL